MKSYLGGKKVEPPAWSARWQAALEKEAKAAAKKNEERMLVKKAVLY